MARPNLLVGHFPLRGAGATDTYLIYGNLFYDNPSEALFQGEGNITLYNNVFVNPHGPGVHIQPHNATPREIEVFHNTVVARGDGIVIRGVSPGFEPLVFGNAVFADPPFSGSTPQYNLGETLGAAERYLRSPYASPPALDVSPKRMQVLSHVPPPEVLSRRPDSNLDFSGTPRVISTLGALTYRADGWPTTLDLVAVRRGEHHHNPGVD